MVQQRIKREDLETLGSVYTSRHPDQIYWRVYRCSVTNTSCPSGSKCYKIQYFIAPYCMMKNADKGEGYYYYVPL